MLESNFILPTDLPGYNLRLWLDAADASTITESGGLVSQWDDKSGNGNDAAQGTGSAQPEYSVRQQNGLATLEFNGSKYLTTSAFSSALAQPNTIFIVSKRDAVVADDYLIDGLTGTDRHASLVSGAGKYQLFAGAGLEGGAINTVAEMQTIIINGASTKLYINGALNASGTEGAHSLDGLTIGAAYGLWGKLDGFIAEILIYDRLLSASEIAATESSLNNKWGLY